MKRISYGSLFILVLACTFLVGAGTRFVPKTQDITATPAPTSESTPQVQTTPSADLASSIEDVATEVVTGIQNLSLDEALRLLIWFGVLILAVVFGGRLVYTLLRRLARRTDTTFDDALLEVIGPQIRWFIAAVGFHLATLQIEFVSNLGQSVLGFISFSLYLFVVLATLWRSIDFSAQWYIESQGPDIDANLRDQLIPWAVRLARFFVIFVAIGAFLAYFGVNLLAIVAALGIGGFAIGLAFKDTITNIISGVMIMIDKPFQVGERIHIPVVDTWGDVVVIGMRSTRVLTRDNRLVIVPNAVLVENAVINYSQPDPSYRLEVDVGIAYNGNISWITKVLEDTVRGVDGVMADKAVDVLFTGFGDAGMDFRVRWWIASPGDKRRITHRVCSSIQDISAEKGIELPDTTFAVVNTIKISPEDSPAISIASVPDQTEQDTADASNEHID